MITYRHCHLHTQELSRLEVHFSWKIVKHFIRALGMPYIYVLGVCLYMRVIYGVCLYMCLYMRKVKEP